MTLYFDLFVLDLASFIAMHLGGRPDASIMRIIQPAP